MSRFAKNGIIVNAQDYSTWKHRLHSGQIGRFVAERLFNKYRDQMDVLRQLDNELRRIALGGNAYNIGIKSVLKQAQEALSKNRLIDAVYFIGVLADINREMIGATKQTVDTMRGQLYESLSGTEETGALEQAEQQQKQYQEFLAQQQQQQAGQQKQVESQLQWLYKKVWGDPLEESWKKEVQKYTLPVQRLNQKAEAYLTEVLAIFDRMGVARASGKIDAWMAEHDKLAAMQPKFFAEVGATFSILSPIIQAARNNTDHMQQLGDKAALEQLQKAFDIWDDAKKNQEFIADVEQEVQQMRQEEDAKRKSEESSTQHGAPVGQEAGPNETSWKPSWMDEEEKPAEETAPAARPAEETAPEQAPEAKPEATKPERGRPRGSGRKGPKEKSPDELWESISKASPDDKTLLMDVLEDALGGTTGPITDEEGKVVGIIDDSGVTAAGMGVPKNLWDNFFERLKSDLTEEEPEAPTDTPAETAPEAPAPEAVKSEEKAPEAPVPAAKPKPEAAPKKPAELAAVTPEKLYDYLEPKAKKDGTIQHLIGSDSKVKEVAKKLNVTEESVRKAIAELFEQQKMRLQGNNVFIGGPREEAKPEPKKEEPKQEIKAPSQPVAKGDGLPDNLPTDGIGKGSKNVLYIVSNELDADMVSDSIKRAIKYKFLEKNPVPIPENEIEVQVARPSTINSDLKAIQSGMAGMDKFRVIGITDVGIIDDPRVFRGEKDEYLAEAKKIGGKFNYVANFGAPSEAPEAPAPEAAPEKPVSPSEEKAKGPAPEAPKPEPEPTPEPVTEDKPVEESAEFTPPTYKNKAQTSDIGKVLLEVKKRDVGSNINADELASATGLEKDIVVDALANLARNNHVKFVSEGVVERMSGPASKEPEKKTKKEPETKAPEAAKPEPKERRDKKEVVLEQLRNLSDNIGFIQNKQVLTALSKASEILGVKPQDLHDVIRSLRDDGDLKVKPAKGKNKKSPGFIVTKPDAPKQEEKPEPDVEVTKDQLDAVLKYLQSRANEEGFVDVTVFPSKEVIESAGLTKETYRAAMRKLMDDGVISVDPEKGISVPKASAPTTETPKPEPEAKPEAPEAPAANEDAKKKVLDVVYNLHTEKGKTSRFSKKQIAEKAGISEKDVEAALQALIADETIKETKDKKFKMVSAPNKGDSAKTEAPAQTKPSKPEEPLVEEPDTGEEETEVVEEEVEEGFTQEQQQVVNALRELHETEGADQWFSEDDILPMLEVEIAPDELDEVIRTLLEKGTIDFDPDEDGFALIKAPGKKSRKQEESEEVEEKAQPTPQPTSKMKEEEKPPTGSHSLSKKKYDEIGRKINIDGDVVRSMHDNVASSPMSQKGMSSFVQTVMDALVDEGLVTKQKGTYKIKDSIPEVGPDVGPEEEVVGGESDEEVKSDGIDDDGESPLPVIASTSRRKVVSNLGEALTSTDPDNINNWEDADIIALLHSGAYQGSPSEAPKLFGAQMTAAKDAISKALGKRVEFFGDMSSLKGKFQAAIRNREQSKKDKDIIPEEYIVYNFDPDMVTYADNPEYKEPSPQPAGKTKRKQQRPTAEASVEQAMLKLSHKNFYQQLKKAPDIFTMANMMLNYSSKMEDRDPALSVKLLVRAKEILDVE